LPLLSYLNPDEFAGQEGYFEGRTEKESSPDSLNEEMQRKLWRKSVTWCHLDVEDTVIEL
jgi:hypothetical protein